MPENDRELLQLMRQHAQQSPGHSMPFEDYMQAALYAPGLGYYRRSSPPMGSDGDYITAPERSPLFAVCIARECMHWRQKRGGGDIAEIGPGSGALAAQLLLELAELKALPERMILCEVEPAMRDFQRRRIAAEAPEQLALVQWRDRLPDDFRGLCLANEVLDAQPVARFRIEGGRAQEIHVAFSEVAGAIRPQEVAKPMRPGLARFWERLAATLPAPLAEGYSGEINRRLKRLLQGICRRLSPFALLIFDYGNERLNYYAPERTGGSLQCHRGQRVHYDPYAHVGMQDLSADVDFTAVAEAVGEIGDGLEILGYTVLGNYLLATGLTGIAEGRMHRASQRDQLQIAAEIKTLTFPSDMGERFRVLAVGRGSESSDFIGFDGRDLRSRLKTARKSGEAP